MQKFTKFQIEVENTTDEVKDVVLFGFNQYLPYLNYGNPIGIKITPTKSNLSYLELLSSTANNSEKISLTRISSENPKQFYERLNVWTNHKEKEPTVQYLYNEPKEHYGTSDIHDDYEISADTNIKFKILPKTKAIYTFF